MQSNKQNGGGKINVLVTDAIPVMIIGSDRSTAITKSTKILSSAVTTVSPYRDEIVDEEFTELQETIMKTIENNEKVEELEADLEPGETLKKDDFDDVFDQNPIKPIVKSILENGDREGDYIVEDIPNIDLTNTILPTTTNDEIRFPERSSPVTTTTISTPTQFSRAVSENTTSTYNTIKTSPSVTWTSLDSTTMNQTQMVITPETGSTTELKVSY